MTEKGRKQRRRRTNLIFVFTAVFCILSIVIVFYIVNMNKERYIDYYKNEQQLLVDVVAGEAKTVLDKGSKSDTEDLKNILSRVNTSGNRYWVGVKDSKVFFVKNNQTSRDYYGKKLNDIVDDDIVSIKSFISNNHTYSIIMITDTPYAFISSGVDKVNIYIYLYLALTIIVYLITLTSLTLRTEDMSKKINENIEEINEKNKLIESFSDANFIQDYKSNVTEVKQNNNFARTNEDYYKFKFYVNARHSIYINGNLGEKHPHTWEISIVAKQNSESFEEFNIIENTVEDFFAKYQDVYINDFKPFDVINPTLENICRYFNTELSNVMSEIGWYLEKIEVSETPTRTYLIDNNDQYKII